MIIGITGTFGAGKDLIARHLESKGFQHLSTADILREEAIKRSLSVERESLRLLSNELKKEKGGDYLARKAVDRINKKDVIISAIRSVDEVNFLKNIKGFKLIFIDAPIKLRYERVIQRSRVGEETISFETFKNKEELETSGKSSQRLDYCRQEADFVIENSGTIAQLNKEVDKLIEMEGK